MRMKRMLQMRAPWTVERSGQIVSILMWHGIDASIRCVCGVLCVYACVQRVVMNVQRLKHSKRNSYSISELDWSGTRCLSSWEKISCPGMYTVTTVSTNYLCDFTSPSHMHISQLGALLTQVYYGDRERARVWPPPDYEWVTSCSCSVWTSTVLKCLTHHIVNSIVQPGWTS